MATAMTGGTSYLLKSEKPDNNYGDGTKTIDLYLYVKTSQNTTTRISTLTLGMYVKAPYNTGSWGEYGTSSLAGHEFNGAISSFSGTKWLVSDVEMTVAHDSSGAATARIPWSWGVNSPWGNYEKPSGTYVLELPNIGAEQTTVTYTACGKPTNLSITDNNDNTLTISCRVGNDGDNNASKSVELYVTFNNRAPSTSSYDYMFTLVGEQGDDVTARIININKTKAKNLLGDSYSNTVKFTARTIGAANNSSYYSGLATAVSKSFTWRSAGSINYDETQPPLHGEVIGLNDYEVELVGEPGINNPIMGYQYEVYDVEDLKTVVYRAQTQSGCDTIPSTVFEANHAYKIIGQVQGTYSNFDSVPISAGVLYVKNIEQPLPDFDLTIEEAGTIPAVDIYGYKTFINIGTGDIFTVTWNPPIAEDDNEAVDYAFRIRSNNTNIFIDKHIGNRTSYTVTADMIAAATTDDIEILVLAYGPISGAYNSSWMTASVRVRKGCGCYIKDNSTIPPTMKRAVALAKVPTAGGLQWDIVEDLYIKGTDGLMHKQDISYEVLTDNFGAQILDKNDEQIETL